MADIRISGGISKIHWILTGQAQSPNQSIMYVYVSSDVKEQSTFLGRLCGFEENCGPERHSLQYVNNTYRNSPWQQVII